MLKMPDEEPSHFTHSVHRRTGRQSHGINYMPPAITFDRTKRLIEKTRDQWEVMLIDGIGLHGIDREIHDYLQCTFSSCRIHD